MKYRDSTYKISCWEIVQRTIHERIEPIRFFLITFSVISIPILVGIIFFGFIGLIGGVSIGGILNILVHYNDC